MKLAVFRLPESVHASTVYMLMLAAVLCLPLILAPLAYAQSTTVDMDNADALIARILEDPLLYNFDTETLVEIFELGQSLGNRANVFTKVGDSNTTNGDFLRPFGIANARYCRLGDYDDLQSTIDFFSVSPREGYDNSFDTISRAAINGLTSAAALDPFWAQKPPCDSGESPLACEYRISRPSVAIIMLGLMDFEVMDVDRYHDNMALVIEQTLDAGVIPVLTNNVALPDVPTYMNSLRFNVALADLADEYDLPLINLWAAAQDLPDYGIGPDRTHLSAAVGEFCAFDGSEQVYGGTLRNLLTLQALDSLRQTILEQPQN